MSQTKSLLALVLLLFMSQYLCNQEVVDSRMLFMYVGMGPFGKRYKTYTVEDLNKMDHVQEFVILPSCDPNIYGLGPYDDIVKSMMELIVKIRNSTRKDAGIWIATPGFDIEYAPFPILYPIMRDFIFNLSLIVHNLDNGQYWKNNVRGIYFNIESVYGKFDPNNAISNAVIKLANHLAKHIHTKLSKKFLWVPYLKIYADIPLRITTVANMDIFDYILLQPMWYFSGTRRNNETKENLDWTFWSVKNNAISDKDGVPLLKRNHFLSKIGIQMEIDRRAGSPGIHRERFFQYVERFKELTKKNVSFSFYADSEPDVMAILDLINNFYNF
jgi:hypothetical protein